MDRRNHSVGAWSVLAAGVLWGTVGPAQVLADSSAGAVAVGGARIFSGGLILAGLVLVTDRGAFRGLTRRAWPQVAAASAATGTFQASFFSAVDRTGAAVATAVVFGLVPVSTGLCERLVLGTRLGRRWWAGTACAVGGVALLMVPASSVRVDPLGIALSLVGGTCFGVYTVSAKVLTGRDVGMPAAVSVTLLVGGAALLPWTLAELPALAEPRSAALVAWLGVAATAVAYMAFVGGLGRVTAATAGTLSLVEPLVATALAIAVLGERPSAPVAAGSLLLLGGLFVVSVPAKARRRTGTGGADRTAAARYDGRYATGAVKVETTTGERK
jgi:DME family drug/metabolite transporter